MAVDKRHERMLEEILKAPGNGEDFAADSFPRSSFSVTRSPRRKIVRADSPPLSRDMRRLSCRRTPMGLGQLGHLPLRFLRFDPSETRHSQVSSVSDVLDSTTQVTSSPKAQQIRDT